MIWMIPPPDDNDPSHHVAMLVAGDQIEVMEHKGWTEVTEAEAHAYSSPETA